MNKQTKILLLGAAALAAVWFFTRKAAADTKEAAGGGGTSGGGTSGGGTSGGGTSGGGTSGGGTGSDTGNLDGRDPGWNTIAPPDLIDSGKRIIGGIVGDSPVFMIKPDPVQPKKPGFSPSDPVPSKSVTPAFEGYILVESGDTLGKIAQRLGMHFSGWRNIRDKSENAWLKKLCPRGSSCSMSYYGGESGIPLFPRFGKTVGVDCSAPGWGPDYDNVYHSKNTGQLPVLYWDRK